MVLSKQLALLIAVTIATACGVAANPGAECEWCGAHEAPAQLSSEITIAPTGEPGSRLVLTGTVYEADGATPAGGVLIYLYHTNARGRYPRRGDEAGNARRHGYLRGWVRTGDDGEYTVHTIVPGSYPMRSEPAHIHITVKEPDRDEYWIDSVLFEGDPNLTPKERSRQTGRGGPGIVELRQLEDGTFRAVRDIVLMPLATD